MKVADRVDLGEHECSDGGRLELDERKDMAQLRGTTTYQHREDLRLERYRIRKKEC